MLKPFIDTAECRELSDIILHEARNSLSVIGVGLSSCQRLELSDELESRLNMLVDEVKHLTHLITDLSAHDHCSVLQLRPLSLHTLARELLELTQWLPIVGSRHVRLIEAETNSEMVVQGDRDRLKQVLLNLIKNACEAVPEGAEVLCQLRVDDVHDQIQINIHNGGEPIPPKILPQLTQPFLTTKPSGMGLGLTIVRQIIEAHNGTLQITSSREAGTTVTVRLPALSPEHLLVMDGDMKTDRT